MRSKWTPSLVKKEAKKYTGKGARARFFKGSNSAYYYASRNGFLVEILAHMTGGRTYWTKPLASKEAKKYKTRGAFKKGSPSAYGYAQRNGFLVEILAHMTDGRTRTYWTKPLASKEAKKYKTRGAFKKGSPGAYEYARKNGLLPEIGSHMQGRKIDILKGIRNAVRGMKRKRATK